MEEKKKKKIIKDIESQIESIKENKKKESSANLDVEYEKLKKRLHGLKKGFILKKYKRFKIFISLGAIILFVSIFFSITGLNFSFIFWKIIFSFDENLWNKLFYLGLSLFTVSYIFYQIVESNKDKARFIIAEAHIKRLSEIDGVKKREQDIQKMLRAIEKLDALKSISNLENTKDEDLMFLYDEVYVKALQTKLKSLKKR